MEQNNPAEGESNGSGASSTTVSTPSDIENLLLAQPRQLSEAAAATSTEVQAGDVEMSENEDYEDDEEEEEEEEDNEEDVQLTDRETYEGICKIERVTLTPFSPLSTII